MLLHAWAPVIEVLFRRISRILGTEASANGRSLAYVWGFGSTCLTAVILLPHPRDTNVGGLVAVAVVGYLFAALMAVWAATIPRGVLEAMTYFGQLLITALVLFWGAADAPFLLFHLWLVVHSFHFLPVRRASMQVLCAAILFVFATVVTNSNFPAAACVTGVGSILTIGLLVGAFRERLDGLLDATIRARAQSEAAIAAARDEAIEASRLKSEFVANMSHEIRTPLNAVIGMTGLLLYSDLTARQRDYAETARVSGEALLGVVNDILDFSKIEAGRMDLEELDFDLRAAVDEAADLIADLADAKGLELAVEVGPDVALDVRGDPGRLRQILLNLLGNAVKFTATGGIVVRVGAEPDDGLVRFEVADTGIGIAADDQAGVFQSFSQADASTTRKFGGTGLGLTICRQLVDLMGGRIGVESTPGHGATFWFTARLAPAAAPALDGVALAGLAALVVSDDEADRAPIEHDLLAWGMRAVGADSGPHAHAVLGAAAARGEPFPLAVVEHHMAGMDGMALARAIKGDPAVSATKVVLLTSLGRRDRRRSPQGSDIDAFVTTPIRPAALYGTLVGVMGSGATDRTPLDVTARPHLLVVEDDLANQKVATGMLERLGYQVDIAGDGAAAVEAVARIDYAAVLMDCQMPDMDGYSATATIRDNQLGGLRTPIIAMTAGARHDDEERARVAGMDDYLTKPVHWADLEAVLDRWAPRPWRVATGARPEPCPEPAAASVLDAKALAGLRELEAAGGVGTLDDLVGTFLANARMRLEQLRAAIDSGETGATAQLSHSLKGSCGNLAAVAMGRLSADLEAAAATGERAAAAEIYTRLSAEFSRVDRALRAAFPGVQAGP